jgi:hypothetical protein
VYFDSISFDTNLPQRFEITGVLPGRYTLIGVTMPPGETPWSLRPKIFGALLTVDVTDRDNRDLDIPLQELPAIPGVVMYAGSCAPDPVQIMLPGGEASTVSGADGRFAFNSVKPGHLGVSVIAGRAKIISARIGDREVLQDGFDYPAEGSAGLRILMSCSVTRDGQ